MRLTHDMTDHGSRQHHRVTWHSERRLLRSRGGSFIRSCCRGCGPRQLHRRSGTSHPQPAEASNSRIDAAANAIVHSHAPGSRCSRPHGTSPSMPRQLTRTRSHSHQPHRQSQPPYSSPHTASRIACAAATVICVVRNKIRSAIRYHAASAMLAVMMAWARAHRCVPPVFDIRVFNDSTALDGFSDLSGRQRHHEPVATPTHHLIFQS